MNTLKGHCLCGAIEFEFQSPNKIAMNCHCSMCRRSHGAAFASQLLAKRSTLTFIQGESLLGQYASSTYGVRCFCKQCGSRLMNYASETSPSDYMSVALSSLAESYDIEPSGNVHCASKAPWVQPCNTLDNFEEFPPDFHQYLS